LAGLIRTPREPNLYHSPDNSVLSGCVVSIDGGLSDPPKYTNVRLKHLTLCKSETYKP